MHTTIKWISIFLLKKFIIPKNADYSDFEKHLTINLKILIFLTWSISPEIVNFNLNFFKNAQSLKLQVFTFYLKQCTISQILILIFLLQNLIQKDILNRY